MSATIFQIQSTLILAMLYLGVYFKRDRKRHAIIMILAIIWDLLLILQIEFTREAIAKAMKPVTNSMLLNFHITIAVITVLLYFYLIAAGFKLLEGKYKYRSSHKKAGMLALTLRTLTYITSFFVV